MFWDRRLDALAGHKNAMKQAPRLPSSRDE
jgi:hypothetical protein